MPDLTPPANTEQKAADASTETPPKTDEKPAADANAGAGADGKPAKDAQPTEAEKTAQRIKQLEADLNAFKARELEAERAKLSEADRLKAEKADLEQARETFRQEQMRAKVAAEFNLPDKLAARLSGKTEDEMRADARDLAEYAPKARAGSHTDPPRDNGSAPTFKRSQLRDNAFFEKNREAILLAQREGRITND